MRIWLITVGEPLPIDSDNERLLRTGLLSEELADRGHDVTWWSSAFDHARKRQRNVHDDAATLRTNYRINLLRSTSYERNISIRRFINHIGIARHFRRVVANEARPDVIVCSLPTVELGWTAVQYAREARVPVLVDLRDMWPHIIVGAVPTPARWVARIATQRMYTQLRRACEGATGIIGITDGYVAWGLQQARRERGKWDRAFPLASVPPDLTPAEATEAADFWRAHGVGRVSRFVVAFFGIISDRKFDLDTVVGAAVRLNETHPDIAFVLCGDGDAYERYRGVVCRMTNVVMPGWVGRKELLGLMEVAAVGLAPYYATPDFRLSIPNKVIEYLGGALPVVSSLSGEVEALLARHACGATYSAGAVDGLVSAILALYEDQPRRERMSAAARALFEGEFSAEKVYPAMASFLERLGDAGEHDRPGDAPAG